MAIHETTGGEKEINHQICFWSTGFNFKLEQQTTTYNGTTTKAKYMATCQATK
jgi:hypothetical protein